MGGYRGQEKISTQQGKGGKKLKETVTIISSGLVTAWMVPPISIVRQDLRRNLSVAGYDSQATFPRWKTKLWLKPDLPITAPYYDEYTAPKRAIPALIPRPALCHYAEMFSVNGRRSWPLCYLQRLLQLLGGSYWKIYLRCLVVNDESWWDTLCENI